MHMNYYKKDATGDELTSSAPSSAWMSSFLEIFLSGVLKGSIFAFAKTYDYGTAKN